MKKIISLFVIMIALLLSGCTGVEHSEPITSFNECEAQGYPVMESYPRQCRTPDGQLFVEDLDESEGEQLCTKAGTNSDMTLDDALEIAKNSECAKEGSLKNTYFCNEYSGTWWFDLDIESVGCNPACVVDVETKEAEINWRCTGAIPVD